MNLQIKKVKSRELLFGSVAFFAKGLKLCLIKIY